MFAWQQTLISISNENDHEVEHNAPKTVNSLSISSPGRYVIVLQRTPIASSHEKIQQQILEELGLDDLQINPQNQTIPEENKASDLSYVFSQSKITLEGQVGVFKGQKGIGSIQGYRNVINDGNTIVHHFWDSAFHYILYHEIKY